MKNTSVPFQDLRDVPALQIPKINFHIFTSTHDVLGSRSKISKETVSAVGVASVGLDTS